MTSFSLSLPVSSARASRYCDTENSTRLTVRPLIRSEIGLVLEDHGIVAVGKIAHHDRGGVDAAGGRDRQGIHVGDGDGVKPPAVYWLINLT